MIDVTFKAGLPMNLKHSLIIFLTLLFTIDLSAQSSETLLKDTVINITDDGNEWPPYTYYKTVNGKRTGELTGYSVDVISEIFREKGISFRITLLPWKREQVEVEKGTSFQMFLNATYNRERDKKYYISEPYYSTNGYYFYSRKKFPDGPRIKSLNDLKKFRIAGLLGHNYTDYGISDKNIYLGSGDYESLALQLHTGRYDIFLESREIVAGWSILNRDILSDKSLGCMRVPDMKPVYFHMMFTRNETGLELKRIVDAGLRKMAKSGRLDKIRRKYLPD